MTTSSAPVEPAKAAVSKTRSWWWAGGLAVGVVAASLTMAMRSSDPAPAGPSTPQVPWLEDGVIHFPEAFAQREQLTFQPVKEVTLTPTLTATGEITWDARRVVALGARIQGRVRKLNKIEGETVHAGEVVAELESAEVGRAQAEVLKARAREQVAKLDAERERKLADAKVSAERDAQFAAANAEALTAERVAAEKAVEALGGSVHGEMGVLPLKSPLAGTVVEARVRRGETVEPTDTLLVVADLSKVWVELQVYERDLLAVREGDKVELALPADRTRVEGVVEHVSEQLDPEQRMGHVRVVLDNPDRKLKPGLSMTASIHASGPRETRLAVPREALTRIDGRPIVFVKSGDGAVTPREVLPGREDGVSVAVVKGLAQGEEVVTRGVLALKAEVFR